MTEQPTKTLSLAEVRDLAKSVLISAGADTRSSDVLADIVTRSERDGPRSHGLRMLPVYVQSFTSGYANGPREAQNRKGCPGAFCAVMPTTGIIRLQRQQPART